MEVRQGDARGPIFSSGEPGGDGSPGGETLNTPSENDIADINPTTSTDLASFGAITNVMERLYRLDENSEPGMAEEVQVSDDGRNHTSYGPPVGYRYAEIDR